VIARISTSFVFALALLMVLGHACELPIGLTGPAHAHHGHAQDASDHHAQDASDHHTADSQFECDAVLAVQTSTHVSCVDLAVHPGRPLVLASVATHVVTAVPRSFAIHQRPPLFLLHASLLI
jgi:hypothetical protein